ncbi:hypothetical protein Y032_0520g2857 [Ancylostoma ceylanicum]|uniref:Serine-threonine/tyrosine-protein kinase catalytic domain-containing protein n=1 Tax=Ancylostoma ceylanicum TaxID=53326 RepID=A0A016WSD9_9BILA|nr:hypothetical protein Y032_0520g2857 [Ancylostoma ceylanicum]
MTLARGDKLGRIPFTDEGIITSECAELQQLELLSKESPRAVLIYEIFAGTGPYEDMRNSVVKKMIVEGKLNKFPSDTPDDVVTFVNEKLWCKDPDKRPDFASIVGTLEKLVAAHADKVPEAPEDKSLVMASEGKTTATVDLDVPDVKKAAAKKAATEPKSSVTEVGDKKAGPTSEDATSKEGTKKPADATKAAAPAKEAASKDVKDGGKKTGVEVSTQQKLKDASSYLKPPSAELSKSSHVDVDSHREKEEINVEIRTKPIFGRRSKFTHVYTTGRRSGGVLLHSRMVFCIEKGVCFLLIPYVKSMKSYENVHDDGYGSTEILHNDRSSRANVQENI